MGWDSKQIEQIAPFHGEDRHIITFEHTKSFTFEHTQKSLHLQKQ